MKKFNRSFGLSLSLKDFKKQRKVDTFFEDLKSKVPYPHNTDLDTFALCMDKVKKALHESSDIDPSSLSQKTLLEKLFPAPSRKRRIRRFNKSMGIKVNMLTFSVGAIIGIVIFSVLSLIALYLNLFIFLFVFSIGSIFYLLARLTRNVLKHDTLIELIRDITSQHYLRLRGENTVHPDEIDMVLSVLFTGTVVFEEEQSPVKQTALTEEELIAYATSPSESATIDLPPPSTEELLPPVTISVTTKQMEELTRKLSESLQIQLEPKQFNYFSRLEEYHAHFLKMIPHASTNESTFEQTFEKVRGILAQITGSTPETITKDTLLADVLSAKSRKGLFSQLGIDEFDIKKEVEWQNPAIFGSFLGLIFYFFVPEFLIYAYLIVGAALLMFYIRKKATSKMITVYQLSEMITTQHYLQMRGDQLFNPEELMPMIQCSLSINYDIPRSDIHANSTYV